MPEVQETQVQSLGQGDPLEEEMATHSSVLTWEILWTEEPDGLQSMEVKVLVDQSCPTLSDPMNCSPPGSSVHRISQARILEWVAICFSRRSF